MNNDSLDLVNYRLDPFSEVLKEVNNGENILVENGETFSLMKFESFNIEKYHANIHRYNRNVSVVSWPGELLPKHARKQIPKQKGPRLFKKEVANIYGTHRLDFSYDKEFDFYMPGSTDEDLFVTVAEEFTNGQVVSKNDNIQVYSGDNNIIDKLSRVVRESYINSVVIPFLERRITSFKMPKMSKRRFFSKKKSNPHIWIDEVSHDLDHGSFLYSGSKEEVYLLTVAKNKDGSLYYQGTYSTSAKPLLFFSNNYLGHFSKHDMEKPLFSGDGPMNCAEYRVKSAAGFNGKSFIFPAIGRHQNCKNSIFTGTPEVITGDIEEAVKHFRNTDFSEFEDILVKFNENSLIIPDGYEKDGKFYY